MTHGAIRIKIYIHMTSPKFSREIVKWLWRYTNCNFGCFTILKMWLWQGCVKNTVITNIYL